MRELKQLLSILAGFTSSVIVAVIIVKLFGTLGILGFIFTVLLCWIIFILVADWMLK